MVIFAAVSCSIPQLPGQKRPVDSLVSVEAAYKCALLANEGLSSYTPVKGSFDCFSEGYQQIFIKYGYTNDADLARFVQTVTEFTVQNCNVNYKPDSTHYAFLFSSTSMQASDGRSIAGIYVDLDLVYVSTKTGKVDAIQEAGQNQNFDVPLPQNPTCTTSVTWPPPKYTD